jgi:hypothetical protein
MSVESCPSDMVTSQTDSRFFQIPYDNRSAVYELLIPDMVHVYLRENQVVTSLCVSSEAINEDGIGLERQEGLPPEKPGMWHHENTHV